MTQLIASGSKKISQLTSVSGIPELSSSAIPIVLGGETVQISHNNFLNSTVFNKQNTFTQPNTFNGVTTFNNDITVDGGIVANIITVQTVSSSVVYSSGSNIFGNLPINTHQFTGSVSVSRNVVATSFTGSLDYTNLDNIPNGIVSSSSQVSFDGIVDKPTLVSGSSQIDLTGTTNYESGIKTRLNAETVVTSSQQIKTLLPNGTVSGSSQVSFDGIVDKPTLVSGSSQVSFDGIVDKPTLVSGSSQIEYGDVSNIPNGIVSSSTQINQYNIFATTGSNGFVGNQNINGDVIVTGSLIVSGSNTFRNIGRAEFTGSVSVDGDMTVTQSITASFFTGSFVGDGSSLSGVSAGDVDFTNILNKPTLVSGSSQIDLTGTTNYVSGIKDRLNVETVISSSQQIISVLPVGSVSGSSQVSFDGIVDKPTLVSSSAQIKEYNVFATTGSNTFIGNQTISGSLTVSGSSTFTNIGRTELTGSVEVDGDVGVYGNITVVQKTIEVLGFPSGQPAFYSEGDILLSGSLSIHVEELGQSFDVAEQFQQAFSSISFTQGEIEIISSSYATTGSNTFIGNQTISGSLVLTGSVTSSRVLTDAVRFNTSAGVSVGVGELVWNNSDGTLDLGMKGGVVVQQIGQEIFYEVRNETGIQIPNGTAVFANGVTAGSGRITVAPYTADGSVREVRFLGLATENISTGVNGFVTHFGYVRGLDTRGDVVSSIAVGDETWAVGDILYVHPTVAGKLTNVKPEHAITVAIIITRHQSVGVLFVRPSSGGHLEDIHDILINTGSLTNGQVLAYNPTSGLWENTNSLSGSYQITGSLNVTGSLEVNNDVKIQNGYVILTNVSQSLEFVDDTAAAAGGVPLGGLYRSGNFILIRIV